VAHIQKKTYKSKKTGKATTTWQARYIAPDGRERTKRFNRRADAEYWLSIKQAEVNTGSWIDPKAGRTTLRAYASQWLEERADLRPTTRKKYQNLLDRHILPSLGDYPLSGLDLGRVRTWWSNLHSAAPTTAANAYRLLSTICTSAVDENKIHKSPCRIRGAGTERAAERPTITVAELNEATQQMPDWYKLAPQLATWCQLRRGEVLGLQRQDIDLLHGTISIQRTWTSESASDGLVAPPKTTAGRRTVTIPSNVLPLLEEHLQRHTGPDRTSWLFEGLGGKPVAPRTLDRAWAKARKQVNRADVRFHDLRHSGLTWAAISGASTAELMRRGGHSSPSAALRYQHATADRDRKIAEALADLARGSILDFGRTSDGLKTGHANQAG
jgi:integrase